MKIAPLLLALTFAAASVKAQLTATPVCPTISIDLLEGLVNERLQCISTPGEVKKVFPCFTNETEETNGSTCGGVFYKDKDFYFFTERDYIEILAKFKGVLAPSIMGVNRNGLFKILGNPKLKDAGWDAFQTKYGTLILYYDSAGKVNKIQMTTKSTSTIKLCN